VILEKFNIASVLTFQGGVFVPSYAAAKGGVAQCATMVLAVDGGWLSR
jgi:hypothetical protein